MAGLLGPNHFTLFKSPKEMTMPPRKAPTNLIEDREVRSFELGVSTPSIAVYGMLIAV